MIKASDLVKLFGDYPALKTLNTHIEKGSIYGLVGSNGSGKSTFLRLIAGVYQADGGSVLVDSQPVFENIVIKNRIFFVSDDLYFAPQSTVHDMAKFYRSIYTNWDEEYYQKLCGFFPIDPAKKINTFSKGMKRQAALLLAMATRPDLLLLDEAFDGLDPIIRGAVRRLLADEIASREMTVIITSHNLRELEDLCDHVGLLHQGTVVFERELDELKLGFCKIQAAFKQMPTREQMQELKIMQMDTRGSLLNLIVRTTSSEAIRYMDKFSPLFIEAIPLTLEEVFIHEMEAVGYDYNNVLF